MAVTIVSVNVYKINSLDPIPLAQVPMIGFPTGGCLLRKPVNDDTLSTGIRPYGIIQVIGTNGTGGDQYWTDTPYATLVTAFNA
jgi:hypothetical protein